MGQQVFRRIQGELIGPYRRADSGASAILYRSVQVKVETWREDDAPHHPTNRCDERSMCEPGRSWEIGEVLSKPEEPSATAKRPVECGERA